MRQPVLDVDRAAGGHQRLPDHLAAEHTLPRHLRRAATEQVHLELFEVEDLEEGLDGGHEVCKDIWLVDMGRRCLVDGFV